MAGARESRRAEGALHADGLSCRIVADPTDTTWSWCRDLVARIVLPQGCIHVECELVGLCLATRLGS